MKDSFVIYTRYAKHIEKLNMEQRGVLFTAIMNHATGDELPEMDPATDIIAGIIIEDIEECDRKWEETKAKRAEAGRIGGLKSAESRKTDSEDEANDKQVEAKPSKLKQAEANGKQNEANQAVNVNVNVNGLKEKENIKKKKRKSEADFEALWELYPRKNGKKDAKRHYLAAVADGTTFEEVKTGIEAYKRYIKKTGTEPKYVKMGSSFFCQRSWADDWTVKDASQGVNSPPGYKPFQKEDYEREDFNAVPMPDDVKRKANALGIRIGGET